MTDPSTTMSTASLQSVERSGLGTTRATTTHSRRALCCRPHKARSHMNARSHTDIELGIRKPLHEHWTGVLPHCLMLQCRKHSEGSFASSVPPKSRIFGFRGLVSRKASNRTERNPHICLCLSGARARNMFRVAHHSGIFGPVHTGSGYAIKVFICVPILASSSKRNPWSSRCRQKRKRSYYPGTVNLYG